MSNRIVGLVSTYQEGELAVSAVRSLLACCDAVRVLDGPIGDAPPDPGEWDEFRKDPRVIVAAGAWDSDAQKRSQLLVRARAGRDRRPCWGIVLDGDELLVNGGELRPLIAHADAVETATGELQYGIALRILEADGSCSKIAARVLRIDRIERYLISSYHLLLTSGVEVSLPNTPLVLGGEPDSTRIVEGMQARRPLPGEPCILHRSHLRDPARAASRQNVAEADAFAEIDRLGLRHETPRPDGGVSIWLPQ